jgi:hypothetical protein
MDRHNKKTISKLKSLLKDSKNITKKLKMLTQDNLELHFNSVGLEFIKSQFRNIKKLNPSWSIVP